MLRITAAETATEQGWTLEGRLVGPCVGEVRTRWKQRHRLRTDAHVRSILVRSRSSTKVGKDSRGSCQRRPHNSWPRVFTSSMYSINGNPLKSASSSKLFTASLVRSLGGAIAPLSRMQVSREWTLLVPSAKHAPLSLGRGRIL
jgi:hypothetical protein